MSFKSEYILSVVAEHRETRERETVNTDNPLHPDPDHYRYLCPDCLAKGHEVDMKFVSGGTTRKSELHKFNKVTERPVLDRHGEEIVKRKSNTPPDHWDRMPGAARHKCEQPARYSDLRSAALYMNAVALSQKSFLFQLRLPQHGAIPHQEKDAVDLRSTFRLKGMKMKGVADAKDVGRLLSFFADDGGDVQYDQYFHDGVRRRAFAETYFEDVREIHRYLGLVGATHKSKAVICAFMFNPNTSKEAQPYVEEHNGFIDRSVYTIDRKGETGLFAVPDAEEGEKTKMELFVRADEPQVIDHLSEECFHNKMYGSAKVLVVGQSWIDPAHPYRVEMEIYTPFQAQRWERGTGFAPPYKPTRVIDPRPPVPDAPRLTG